MCSTRIGSVAVRTRDGRPNTARRKGFRPASSTMSASEEETVLGKREREAVAVGSSAVDNGTGKDDAMDDSSDDEDVGPMPMPEQSSATNGARKKRKGTRPLCHLSRNVSS